MIGGQNFRSAIIPELPYIPTVSQQLPYVSDLISMCDIVATHELFCLHRFPAIMLQCYKCQVFRQIILLEL
jgi:hypothetical protein